MLTALRDFNEFLKWIREKKFCMMDDHSEEFVKALTPPEKHEDAAAILEERAAMDRDENVEIETLHATIRRLLKYYSLQTHKRKFKQMNADWTLRRMRKYSREPAKAANLPKPHTHKRHKPTHTEKKAKAKATSKAKAASHSRYAQAGRAKPRVRAGHKGVISMWNVWQSKYGGADKGNFPKLQPRYREWMSNASPEEIAALREEAKGATHSIQHGMRAPLGGKAQPSAGFL